MLNVPDDIVQSDSCECRRPLPQFFRVPIICAEIIRSQVTQELRFLGYLVLNNAVIGVEAQHIIVATQVRCITISEKRAL